jgi:DNA-binding PadR family transcriptional regulator
MQSPVNWALLGLIIDRPSYAYELAHRFQRDYDGALSLSSTSHVYTALAALEERGLIEEISGGTGRQPKPRYRAAEGAVGHYQRWLVSQLSEDRRRQRLFALQLATLMRRPELATDVIDGYEQACLAEGSAAPPSSPVAGSEGSDEDHHSRLADRIVSQESRLAVGACLSWVQYVRRELKALTQGSSRR